MNASPAPHHYRSLADRLDFLALDERALARIAALSPLALKHLQPALDKFYDKLATEPEMTRFFSGREQMGRAQARQHEHWTAIATGKLDDDYFDSSLAVGIRHARIGLEPHWYIGGYGLIMETVIKGLVTDWMAGQLATKRKRKPAEIGADTSAFAAGLADLVKAVMVDIDIAVSTYFERLEEEIEAGRKQAEATAATQRHVLEVTGDALANLAAGRLDTRIDAAFEGDFARLREDFNTTAASLDDAMTSIRRSVDAIARSVEEVADTAQDLSDRMTRQAAAIEQSSASLQEVTNTVRDTAAVSDDAATIARGANGAAEDGGVVVKDAVEAMQRIEQSSSKISSIISVIDEIAFQTNLLALNAAVEAARAGEAGRGFAVVASEVRSLAQRSADAARDVTNLIKQSSSNVQDGVGMVKKTGDALARILDQVSTISGHMAEFSQAAQHQATSLTEVSDAIGQLDRLTQENAGFVARSSEAGRELAGEVTDLYQRLGSFRTSA